MEDGEFFHDSVLARLNDDDPKVVKAVLQLGQVSLSSVQGRALHAWIGNLCFCQQLVEKRLQDSREQYLF